MPIWDPSKCKVQFLAARLLCQAPYFIYFEPRKNVLFLKQWIDFTLYITNHFFCICFDDQMIKAKLSRVKILLCIWFVNLFLLTLTSPIIIIIIALRYPFNSLFHFQIFGIFVTQIHSFKDQMQMHPTKC